MLDNDKSRLKVNFEELMELTKNWEGTAWALIEDERYIELTNNIEVLLLCL